MKKLISCLLLAIPFLGICQQKYTVSGVLTGASAKAKMYLLYSKGNTYQKDSCLLKAGAFKFSGVIEEPKLAILVLAHEGKYSDVGNMDTQSVYLEQTPVRVIGKDSVSTAKIIGGILNADNQEKLRMTRELKGPVDTDEPKLVALFIDKHPASRVSLDWLTGFSSNNNWTAACYAKLSPALKQTAVGKAYGIELQQLSNILPGKLAPDFSLPDPTGKVIKLSDFKGKYVLLDFWASYCKPCRAAHPHLKELYAALKPTGKFEILAISLDRTKAPWLKAIDDDQVTWPQVADLDPVKTNKAADLYRVTILPMQFLVGPDGKILPLDVMVKLKSEKKLPEEKKVSQEIMGSFDLSEKEVFAALKKEQLTDVGVKEDFDKIISILSTDIGETELVAELGKLKFPEDSLAIRQLLRTKAVSLGKQKEVMKKNFIAENPNSFVSLYLLDRMELMYSADSYMSAYNALSDKLKQTSLGAEIKNRFIIYNQTPTGVASVDFSRNDQYGKPIKLSDYKGKLVILDFWGTWCIPCRETHPHLKELYNQYKSKGLEIVAVANEKNKDPEKAKSGWLSAIKKDDINWVHVLNKEGANDQDLAKEYAITSYPTKILLDKKGKILMRVSGMMNDEMDVMIKSILDN